MIDMDMALAELNSPERAVRHEVALALGESRDEAAIKPLVALLKDEDSGVRDAAVNSLISIGGPGVAQEVLPFLYEEDVALRNMAVEVLEGLKGDACDALAGLLDGENVDVLQFAVDILKKVGDKSIASKLEPLLSHENPNIRAGVAITLGSLKAYSATQKLVDMLGDEDEWVRFSILEALGSLGSPDIIDRLLDMVGEEDVLKLAAIDAIAMLALPEDGKKVIRLIRDKKISSVLSAETLVELAERFKDTMDDSQKKVLLDIFSGRLKKGGRDEHISVLDGIGLLKDSRAVKPLLQFSKTIRKDDIELKNALKDALVNTGDGSVVADTIKMEMKGLSLLIEALGEIGDPATVKEMQELLGGIDRETKKILLTSLEKIGDASSFDSLVKTLKDDDGHVRELAAKALGRISDERVVPILFDALLREPYRNVRDVMSDVLSTFDESEQLFIDLLENEDDEIRVIAVKALGRLCGDRCLKCLSGLKQVLHDENTTVRKEAVKALGLCDDVEVSSLLANFIKDKDKDVRIAVIDAIAGKDGGTRTLLYALNDSDMWVRFKAVTAIGAKKVAEAEDTLIKLLRTDEIPVKIACAKALEEVGSKRVLDVLKDYTDHEDSYLRGAVMEIINRRKG